MARVYDSPVRAAAGVLSTSGERFRAPVTTIPEMAEHQRSVLRP
ncbi:MAG: hypothetical protein ABJC07_00505 [Acidobacteriota bacterium]